MKQTSIKSKLKNTALALATTSLFALGANAQSNAQTNKTPLYFGNENFGVALIGRGGFSFRGASPQFSITGIPEKLRFAPIHKEDTYASEKNNGPIRDSADLNSGILDIVYLRAGAAFKLKNLELELTGNVTLSSKLGSDDDDDIKERNYTNAPGTNMRGYGAALTYYKLRYSGLSYGGNLEAMIPLWRNKDGDYVHKLVLGGRMQVHPVQIETGWDRYDFLEVDKARPLAKLNERGAYLGYSYECPVNKLGDGDNVLMARIMVGYDYYKFSKSQSRAGIKMNDSESPSLELTIGARF
jgi:hypothetical protein